MGIALIIIVCLIPYLIGSINASIILSKKLNDEDIRSFGSGNAGATNMLRTYGKGPAVISLICDILKGVFGVLFGIGIAYFTLKFIHSGSDLIGINVSKRSYNLIMETSPIYKYLGALFAVLGHDFPVFYGFKGGKGVASSLGVILALNPKVGLIVLAFAILIMAITRFVSLGSISAAVIYVAVDLSYMIFTHSFSIYQLVFDILLAGLLILRHRKNIKKLLNGTENKLGNKKNKTGNEGGESE